MLPNAVNVYDLCKQDNLRIYPKHLFKVNQVGDTGWVRGGVRHFCSNPKGITSEVWSGDGLVAVSPVVISEFLSRARSDKILLYFQCLHFFKYVSVQEFHIVLFWRGNHLFASTSAVKDFLSSTRIFLFVLYFVECFCSLICNKKWKCVFTFYY